MTVPSTKNVKTHSGNGTTTSFPFDFRIFNAEDLEITLTLADGTVADWVLDSDYSVPANSVNRQSGGEIIAAEAPPVGSTLIIRRVLQPLQLTDLRNQGDFLAEVIEDVFDRLTMLIQEAFEETDRSLKRPLSGGGWNALGYPIKNLGASVDPNDAVRKSELSAFATGVIQPLVDEAEDYRDQSVQSAGQAANSATTASNAATTATDKLAEFQGQYYGAYASDPTEDPNGNPPGEGDLYWNTTAKQWRAWNGAAWQQPDTLDGDAATVTTSTGTQLLPAALDKRVIHVPDIADLRALTGLVDGQAVRMTTTGRAGLFVVIGDAMDYAAELAADPQEGVYVETSDGKALRRQHGQAVNIISQINVSWFYTSGSWESAFDAAISFANFVGSTGSSGMETVGVSIRIPNGEYDITAGLSEYVSVDNVTFVGDSPDGVVLLVDEGTAFQFGDEGDATTPNGGGAKDLKFMSESAPDAAGLCVYLPNAVRQRFSGIRLRSINKFAELGSATKQAIAIGFSDVSGWVYNSGNPTYNLVNGAGFYLEQSVMFVQGVPVPASYGSHTAVDGTDFIKCQGSWDTILVNSVTCNRYDRSLNFLNDVDGTVNNIKISQFYGDYSKRGAIFGAPSEAAGTNNTTLISLSQCWFVSINGDGLTFTVDTLGGVSNVELNEVQTGLCSGDGIKFQCPATAIKNVDVTNCLNFGAGGGGAGSGLLLDGVSDITVSGGRYGIAQSGTLASQAVDGVKVTAACRRYGITGVHADGSSSDYSIANPAAQAAGCLVSGNFNLSGTRPSYARDPASETAPASGAGYTNSTPFIQTAYGWGGTVTAFRRNGIKVADSGNSVIRLAPGDSWSSLYSVAPALLLAVEP